MIFLCYRSITYVRAGFGVVDTCFVVRVRPFGLQPLVRLVLRGEYVFLLSTPGELLLWIEV